MTSGELRQARYAPLADAEGALHTAMGEWVPGTRVHYRDLDLHADLGEASWMDVYMYGITGRRFDQRTLRFLERMWIATSYPEPRIWNNRVAALAGTARSTLGLGVSAALAVSEARIYGRGADVRALDFLYRARRREDAGESLAEVVREELRTCRAISGYGRPLTQADERIRHMMEVARRHGFADGPYVALAYRIEDALRPWRLRMNYAALAAAFAADIGLSVTEYQAYGYVAFLAGMWPCMLDAMSRPEGTFFPFRCDRIAYSGPARRAWNRASPGG